MSFRIMRYRDKKFYTFLKSDSYFKILVIYWDLCSKYKQEHIKLVDEYDYIVAE